MEKYTFGNLEIKVLVIGPIKTNVYILERENSCVVFDPAFEAEKILSEISLPLEAIVCTHCHYDHVSAAYNLKKLTGAKSIAFAQDARLIEQGQKSHNVLPCKVDEVINSDASISLLGYNWKVLHTPGHTPGSCCWYLPAEELDNEYGVLISGDTLFEGTYGRTDFEGGSAKSMKESLAKLAKLPDKTLVFPGHGNHTTIAKERNRVLFV